MGGALLMVATMALTVFVASGVALVVGQMQPDILRTRSLTCTQVAASLPALRREKSKLWLGR